MLAPGLGARFSRRISTRSRLACSDRPRSPRRPGAWAACLLRSRRAPGCGRARPARPGPPAAWRAPPAERVDPRCGRPRAPAACAPDARPASRFDPGRPQEELPLQHTMQPRDARSPQLLDVAAAQRGAGRPSHSPAPRPRPDPRAPCARDSRRPRSVSSRAPPPGKRWRWRPSAARRASAASLPVMGGLIDPHEPDHGVRVREQGIVPPLQRRSRGHRGCWLW
jgi:hypothetical protein